MRTFRTIPTIRTIRTRLRQAAPWQAARTTRNSARGQGKLYCSRRGVDGFPRTFPCRSTVPPVLRQFRPASFPPLSESSEKSEGSELSSRPLHRPTGSSVLHPPSLHRSTVTLVASRHTEKCARHFSGQFFDLPGKRYITWLPVHRWSGSSSRPPGSPGWRSREQAVWKSLPGLPHSTPAFPGRNG